MNKSVFLILMFLSSSLLWSQTILVNTEETYPQGGEKASVEIPATFESQVMDELFNQGFIVFNMGSYPVRTPGEEFSPLAHEMARSNGAAYMVNLNIQYRLGEDKINLPASLELRLIRMSSQEEVFRDQIELPSIKGEWEATFSDQLLLQMVNAL